MFGLLRDPAALVGLQGKDMMHNLEDHITELLECTNTAFATIYPHDNTMLIKHWGACWAGTMLDKKMPMFAAGMQESYHNPSLPSVHLEPTLFPHSIAPSTKLDWWMLLWRMPPCMQGWALIAPLMSSGGIICWQLWWLSSSAPWNFCHCLFCTNIWAGFQELCSMSVAFPTTYIKRLFIDLFRTFTNFYLIYLCSTFM